MQSLICLLAVIFLFCFCFLSGENSSGKKGIILDNPGNEQVVSKNKNEEKTEALKVKDNVKKEDNKKNAEIKKSKKVNYPSSFKKGKITLFLNNPTLYNLPSKASRADACGILTKEMKRAEKSIEFALYGIDNQDEIINALKNASLRGVLVKGVSDADEFNVPTYPDTEKLSDYAKITYDNSKFIMHDKFFIIDDKIVMTGSMNISKTGCGGYNSNSVLLIEDENVAKAYKKEFNQMHSGKFKTEKENFSLPLFDIDEGVKLGVYFSPNGGVFEKALLNEIKNAKNKIRVSIFVLTHNQMIDELITAHKRGVEIKVLADALGAGRFREKIIKLRNEGIEVKIENWGGKNHEKTISIDDNVLFMGSANFSYSGFSKNDENVVCIKNKEFARFYNGFFDTLYDSVDNMYLKAFPKAEGLESGNSCYDGIDNDFDGKIDMEDEGCKIK